MRRQVRGDNRFAAATAATTTTTLQKQIARRVLIRSSAKRRAATDFSHAPAATLGRRPEGSASVPADGRANL